MPHHSYPQQDSLSLHGLYCSEQPAGETHPSHPQPTLLEQDLSWEDEELAYLLSKQSQPDIMPELSESRRGAVDWVLRVRAYHGFSSLTTVLAVDYLDRFLSSCSTSRWDRAPWMAQLAAVACLSLAAKVVETTVPLLVDIQVEGSGFLFEAKTIKRMELLVLSKLQWRMNPVTSLSFLDHIARRHGFRNQHLRCEFLRRCEDVLLPVLSDIRMLQFLPSVVAAATMLQVISGLENSGLGEEESPSQLTGILVNDKENVESCRKLLSEYVSTAAAAGNIMSLTRPSKRRYRGSGGSFPGSPRAVVDYACLSSDSSNDSWAAAPPSIPHSPAVAPPNNHCII